MLTPCYFKIMIMLVNPENPVELGDESFIVFSSQK